MYQGLRLIIVTLLLFTSAYGATENGRLAFRVYTDRDGLPQNIIETMTIDRRGFLWIGTQDGAAYYNGRRWTRVNMPDRIVSNRVYSILNSNDGAFWFATDNGLYRLKESQWTRYHTGTGLPSDFVYCVIEAKAPGASGIVLWAGTSQGIARFENNQWTNITKDQATLKESKVRCLVESVTPTGGSVLWAGTYGNGLARYEQGQWTVYTKANSRLPDDIVLSLLETTEAQGRELWAGTLSGGLARIEKEQFTIFNSANGSLPNDEVNTLLQSVNGDGSRSIWAGTNGGLAILTNGRWSTIDTKTGLPNNIVWRLIEMNAVDGSRLLWIGTYGGLARFKPGKWSSFDVTTGLPTNGAFAMMESRAAATNGEIWMGTLGNGLAYYKAGRWIPLNTANSGLPNNVVWAMTETVDNEGVGTHWFGTSGGLARLHKGRWTTFTSTNSPLPHNQVNALYETVNDEGQHALWIGTFNGLARLQDGQWQVFNNENAGFLNNFVRSITETRAADGTRALWVATTRGGLACYRQGRWIIYHNGNSPLPNNIVLSLYKTRSERGDIIWAGTEGGLCRIDVSGDSMRWRIFNDTARPALPNNSISAISSDSAGRIYAFTGRGIAVLTPTGGDDYSLQTYTTEDGLPSSECYAAIFDSSGRMWAGTAGGVAYFEPSKEIADRYSKGLLIERVLLNSKERPTLAGQTLAYNENNLTLEFTLLSYFREQDTRYRSQLIGFDDQPTDWTDNPSRVYTNLPAGSYTFRVWGKDYAENITGPIDVAFTVRPAPWRTWWAYGLYVMMTVGAVYGGMRYRLRSLQHRALELEAKVVARTKELEERNSALAASEAKVKRQAEELSEKNAQLDNKLAELHMKNTELLASQQRADRIFSALAEALPGTVLDGKYRLNEKIGTGGFGAVFHGTHLALDRPIAVKVFRPRPGNDSPEAVERFLREGMSACRINHPNAVAVLDSGISAEGIAFMVMELLDGYTLKDELREKGRLSLNRCVEIIVPVCDVLAEAHASGIIHRDIKPDNIFLHRTRNGEIVKVVDFGIAKLLGDSLGGDLQQATESGMLIGTPSYMAPERLLNKPYDGRVDVYSLGIMLYEMLSGQLPFYSSEGPWAIAVMHATEAPKPLRRLNPGVPREIEALIMRTLSKESSARPTAKEFGAQLINELGIEVELRSSGTFRILGRNDLADCETVSFEPRQPTGEIDPDTMAMEAETLITDQNNLKK